MSPHLLLDKYGLLFASSTLVYCPDPNTPLLNIAKQLSRRRRSCICARSRCVWTCAHGHPGRGQTPNVSITLEISSKVYEGRRYCPANTTVARSPNMHRTCPKSCSVLEQRPCKEMSMMLLHRNIIESMVERQVPMPQCSYSWCVCAKNVLTLLFSHSPAVYLTRYR